VARNNNMLLILEACGDGFPSPYIKIKGSD